MEHQSSKEAEKTWQPPSLPVLDFPVTVIGNIGPKSVIFLKASAPIPTKHVEDIRDQCLKQFKGTVLEGLKIFILPSALDINIVTE